jgi:hypothetical protein
MRIWDLPPKKLCRQHLVAEHGELHSLWAVLTKGKKGFSQHPETLRWRGKLKALYLRHEALVKELEKRNYLHRSPLDSKLAIGKAKQDRLKDSLEEQREILRKKKCGCKV